MVLCLRSYKLSSYELSSARLASLKIKVQEKCGDSENARMETLTGLATEMEEAARFLFVFEVIVELVTQQMKMRP